MITLASSQEREIKDSDCTFHYTPVRVVWKKHTQKTLSQKNKECLSQINPRVKYPAVQKTSHHWSGDNQEKTQSFVTKLNLNSTWQVVETSLDRFYVCKIEIYLHKEVKTKFFSHLMFICFHLEFIKITQKKKNDPQK